MPDPRVRRVLMTTDTVGGVWTFTLELARQFGARGREVVLATLGPPPNPRQMAEAASVPNLLVVAGDFKLEWMEDPWSDVRESGRWLLELESKYRPDLIHLNSLVHGDLPWATPALLTAHSCVLSWWLAVKGEQAPAAWDSYRTEVSRSLRAATLVTAPTNSMAATLVENYGLRQPVAVIPNGRDPVPFHRAMKEPFVLTAGRLWDEGKNVLAVARAAGNLPWPVCAAGATENPGGEKATFPGVRTLGLLSTAELAEWYARAAIFALPVRYEPFGLSAVEAGLSGCALVLGDLPSQREVWGDAALFVAPDDENALFVALRSLIDNPKFRMEMSRRSYDRALAFSPVKTANGYLEAYQSAAGRFATSGRNLACVS